ncbi:SDR family NAD(P)-dependent oxidoreductase [Roseibium aggregatum]|uniref:SDR family NAD(P)-dependent oxidoreductase n=1 Tax=Roseibium aggregatum TaxID=187304 RepID=UPI0025ACDB61|nr:SDR family NAD(P)-dependent oxidoreductase [Roseibium aggregatum]WJS05590.1 SDR family NAD(P)-dependent oxidoreductase [Roseibium aggregatum]
MNTYDLAGRTAVITGGARGMGLAIGRKFLEAGANVVLWDINEATLASAKAALHGRAETCPVDVSSFESVEEACRQAVSLFRKIDILVNSAGIAGINTPLADYPVDTWNRVMSINLGGVFHTCKAIVPIMKQNGYGRIVNIASMAGKDGNPNASAYSVSKGAVITLTKSLGKELARDGICVNAVAPAVIETEMLADVTEEQIGYMLAKIPMGRMGTVDEIAALVGWLSSQDCSYSTGAVYDLSGGRATY